MKGYVQVYTGDGKGKTTAALGLMLRAVGAGLRVYLGQFLKQGETSEIRSLAERFPEVTVEQYGRGDFIRGEPTDEDLVAAQAGLEALTIAVTSGNYDLVVADEACCAVRAGVISCDDLLHLMDARPDALELVFTGRHAPAALTERANLVTEMTCRKHYYGDVTARRGIEC
jgi:cob(I)alamin adenosyltransferase